MADHEHQWVPSFIPGVHYCKVSWCSESIDEMEDAR